MAEPRPPRVAVVIARYSPVFGGAENQCRLLNRYLGRSGGAEIAFVLTKRIQRALPRRDVVDGVPIRRIGAPGVGRWSEYAFYVAALVQLLVHRHRYDLIHCHATSVIGFVCALVGRVTGCPVVVKVTSNGELFGSAGRERAAGPLHRRLLAGVHRRMARVTAAHAHAVALNAEALDDLAAVGARQATIIPNGVDVAHFAPPAPARREALRAELGLEPSELVFVFAGRFVEVKGADLLLDAFRRLGDRVGPGRARLLMVGSGALQLGVVDELSDPEPLRSHGILVIPPTTDVAPYLAAGDVFVLPSRREGMPNAALEALAAGLPCVLSDIAPHRELAARVPAGAVTLHACGDAAALAEAMQRWLDPTVVAAARNGARISRLPAEFAIDGVTTRYAGLYRAARA